MVKKPKAPKKFKEGTVELWYNFVLQGFRYVKDSEGRGERTRDDWSGWELNTARREYLLRDSEFVYLGRL